MVLIIVGLVLGVGTLAFVQQVGTNGLTCYIVGSVETARTCIHPSIYFGGLGLAAALIIFGIVSMLKNSASRRP